MLFSGLVHTACGILPGEEIYELFVQTGTARRDKTPSGKHVREFAPPYKASDTEAAEQCCEPKHESSKRIRAVFDECTDKMKKTPLEMRGVFYMVTRTGIEPMLQP